MLELELRNSFKKDIRRAKKRNYRLKKLEKIIEILRKEEELPEEYDDHKLTGNWKGHRECHIEPDWLLVYKIEKEELILVLCHTGTHSDIF